MPLTETIPKDPLKKNLTTFENAQKATVYASSPEPLYGGEEIFELTER